MMNLEENNMTLSEAELKHQQDVYEARKKIEDILLLPVGELEKVAEALANVIQAKKFSEEEPRWMKNHADNWIDRPSMTKDSDEVKYAKWCIWHFRMPAVSFYAFEKFIQRDKLFCTYEGKRYRVTGASTMGDIWLNKNFDSDSGYDHRVDYTLCSGWSDDPKIEKLTKINISFNK